MPALSITEAAEKLAKGVENARESELAEIYTELFPEKVLTPTPAASEIARHIRNGLEAEEMVDLCNVVFPKDLNVWYDEESGAIQYNEEMAGYLD